MCEPKDIKNFTIKSSNWFIATAFRLSQTLSAILLEIFGNNDFLLFHRTEAAPVKITRFYLTTAKKDVLMFSVVTRALLQAVIDIVM